MIELNEVSTDFKPKPVGMREFRFDSSYTRADSPVGNLRMEGVANGRYPKKHPILRTDGSKIGAIKNGVSELGYTFCLVYSDAAHCFIVSHVHFGAHGGCVSFLEPSGRVGLFDDTTRFGVSNSISLGDSWVGSEHGFFLLGDGKRLCMVTSSGIAAFDTLDRRLTGRIEFDRFIQKPWSAGTYDLSPKVDNLAVSECSYESDDPVTGENRYANRIHIYNIRTCEKLAELRLESQEAMSWRVRFSECGRFLKVSAENYDKIFEMR